MHVPFGDLQRQYAALAGELQQASQRVLASGWYSMGPEVAAFEQEWAAACGVRHAIGVANGTDALYFALVALGVAAGDEVITVANAGVYSTVAALQAGARPVYVDVDEQTMTMDPAQLEAAITPRTRAILPVHLYGRVADLGAILAVAARHGIAVIEDCAQAHAAALADRPAGSLGACGCFSFYPTKNLGALGDGGAVVTDDDQLAERLRRLRQYGWERKYITAEVGGVNSRLDELQAALLRAKLPHLPAWTARRRVIAHTYSTRLAGTGLLLPEVPPDARHVFHLYVVRSVARAALQTQLRERGIGCDIHYPLPAHQQRPYVAFAPPGGLPVTERLAAEVLSLPLYPELTDAEIAAVVAAIVTL